MRGGFCSYGKQDFTRQTQPVALVLPGCLGCVRRSSTTKRVARRPLRRELKEELGIMPTRWEFLITVDEPHPAENGNGQSHFYLVTAYDGVPQNLQAEEYSIVEWFEFEKAMNLPFAHPLCAEMLAQISQGNGG